MTDGRPVSRLLLDILAYTAARLVLVVVVTAVIFGAASLLGVQIPMIVALLFAIVIGLPLGIWLFTPLRRRATESIAIWDEQRRRDREQLQARLRGDSGAQGGDTREV